MVTPNIRGDLTLKNKFIVLASAITLAFSGQIASAEEATSSPNRVDTVDSSISIASQVPITYFMYWNAYDGASYYEVSLKDVSENTKPVKLEQIKDRKFNLPVLKSNHDYSFWVAAYNSSGKKIAQGTKDFKMGKVYADKAEAVG